MVAGQLQDQNQALLQQQEAFTAELGKHQVCCWWGPSRWLHREAQPAPQQCARATHMHEQHGALRLHIVAWHPHTTTSDAALCCMMLHHCRTLACRPRWWWWSSSCWRSRQPWMQGRRQQANSRWAAPHAADCSCAAWLAQSVSRVGACSSSRQQDEHLLSRKLLLQNLLRNTMAVYTTADYPRAHNTPSSTLLMLVWLTWAPSGCTVAAQQA